MIVAAQKIVRAMDSAVARVYLGLRPERKALLCFLFHSMFRDRAEIDLNVIDYLQRTTVAVFRQLIEYFLEHGYQFVSPADLLGGLDPAGRYALITFDDGYFNNTLALPILEQYKVPATIFVTSENVRLNRCFWWDVLHRERVAEGASFRQIYREGLAMKQLRTDQIDAQLTARFGADAFVPRGEIDRPFTPAELREVARHPYVHLGNHTADHAILTNYEPKEARRQVMAAQEYIRDTTGVTATAIAYPNGSYNQQVARICDEAGLKLGFTIRPGKVMLPLGTTTAGRMGLGRFAPSGESPMSAECRSFRSDVPIYGCVREGYLRMVRTQPSYTGL